MSSPRFVPKKLKDCRPQLQEYLKNTLTEPEQNLYKLFFNDIAERNKLTKTEEFMLLDMALHDFIRVKRIQSLIYEEGEAYKVVMKDGSEKNKVTETAYLLNTVESQFRSSMRELGITRKENRRGSGDKIHTDFSKLIETVSESDDAKEG